MSKTSRSKPKNFEILYYNLKEEYDQLQKDNDEICKEYESTIQMLTDSINELQKQRNSMTKKYSQLEKEKEKLQDKNREKINDIQNLDQKNQKLSQENLNIKNKFKEKEHQIVILENDTEHYLNLIRQNEAVIDELNYKLEEALEDNVTIQTEFEVYKQIMGEKLSRKSDELKEIKSDMFTKNLIIKKLKNKQQENKYANSKYLDLDGISTKKKNSNNNKIIKNNKKIYERKIPNSYTRDNNNFSITCNNNNFEIDLFNNISINSLTPYNKYCITQINDKNDTNVDVDSLNISKKIIPYKEKEKTKTINNYLFNSYKNKMDSITSPSSNRMVKLNSKNYSFNLYKKPYNNENEYQEINKFDLNDIDYNDTTSGLNIFKDENKEYYNQDEYNSLLPNLESGGKLFIDEFENKNNYKKKSNNAKTKPFKNAFLRKLLTSKKLDNNLEKLYNYNQRNRENLFNKMEKLNKLNAKRKITSIK